MAVIVLCPCKAAQCVPGIAGPRAALTSILQKKGYLLTALAQELEFSRRKLKAIQAALNHSSVFYRLQYYYALF